MGGILSWLLENTESSKVTSDIQCPEMDGAKQTSTQKRGRIDGAASGSTDHDGTLTRKRSCTSIADSCDSGSTDAYGSQEIDELRCQSDISMSNTVKFLIDRQMTGKGRLIDVNQKNREAVTKQRTVFTINSLPQQLIVKIFSYLTLQDLLHKVSLVCKTWNNLAQDPDLWRYINVQGQMKVSDEVLKRITSFSQKVCQLNITDARLITNSGVQSVFERCKNIKVLKMTRCQQLTEACFIAVGEHLPMLQKLYLESCFGLTDQALAKIGHGCKHLRYLSVSQCSMVSNEGIAAIAMGCPNLQHLSMDQCVRVSDMSLAVLAEHCPRLESLCCMACSFTDQGLHSCTKLKDLKTLQVPNINFLTPGGVTAVARSCSQLQTLNLCLCYNIDDECMESVTKYAQKLKSIHLVSCSVSDKTLVSIANHCCHIEQVDVGWCKNITDQGVIYLSRKCPSLRFLGLMRCDAITMATITELMEEHPQVTYSTIWLDYQRLLNRATEGKEPQVT